MADVRQRAGSSLAAVGGAVRLVATASPGQFAIAAGLQLLSALAATSLVYAAKLTLDALLGQQRINGAVIAALAVLALATAIKGASGSLQGQQQRLLGEDVSTATWRELLAVMGRVDLQLMDSPSFVAKAERIQNHAFYRPLDIATSTLSLLGSAVTVVALTVAVLAIEPLLVPVLLLAGLPSIFLSRRVGALELGFVERWHATFRLRQYHRRLLTGQSFAKEVRTFQTQPEIEARHLRLSESYRAGLAQHVRRRQFYGAANALITGLFLAFALAVIVWLVSAGRMDLAGAGAAVLAVRLLSGSLDGVFSSVGKILEASAFFAELQEFLKATPVPSTPEPAALSLREGVRLRGVGFRYPETERDVLTGVDLDIAPGQFVALVGENGSGKTTLAKLVSGLYAPTKGVLVWDGQPADDELRRAVRRSVSAIYQDFVQYDLSAADNVAMDPSMSRSSIEAAMRAARIYDAVSRLPQGPDTVLGRTFEGAVELSGGQWQRMALARALVRSAPLLVLDEPSSALDPRTEHELFSDLRSLAEGRTILLVSHRYANLHLADCIVVLQEGRVVEQGTHEQLMVQQGLYAQLYQLQAGSYRSV
ncbi:MAG TPA: ABC transporter ATP-binding protein [Streptomyces sp.]|uniref:ABC transporter ATP-binding protein n=1 Tax=Streptomyces sp. TaxID=1931 RepID=UPI002C15D8C9|nr:ABC transporter ATP-binding protein [Streptomyces sp.]HWU05307.1 ABC transporter ATP-binding protein [Streptomyces sp.]